MAEVKLASAIPVTTVVSDFMSTLLTSLTLDAKELLPLLVLVGIFDWVFVWLLEDLDEVSVFKLRDDECDEECVSASSFCLRERILRVDDEDDGSFDITQLVDWYL